MKTEFDFMGVTVGQLKELLNNPELTNDTKIMIQMTDTTFGSMISSIELIDGVPIKNSSDTINLLIIRPRLLTKNP